ncbi:NUDIX hydrolase [Thermodesulforhabdus norvegica]|uniref:GDP-mannose pyrophosphatase n=1 Tax=Thermodesulforhabdus norvegica TaxID=39841 RepID=A0A1I4QTW9_9BACT|nr:NUDIX hydrolase [Thermodesulforhabdus norvegica]SFM43508.1 ADP-ribose pyrophosphatase [Thermodesulforhabdus norvegica]
MEKFVDTLGVLTVPNFTVHLDEVILKTGRISRRIRIDHPRAVAVIPLIDEERILMVRQYRYALGKDTLEIPAGKVDRNESLYDAVLRELKEETGYTAEDLTPLISFYPAVAYSNEVIDIFLARNLKKLCEPLDEDEISSVEIVHLREALDMIKSGAVKDGKTIIAIFSLFVGVGNAGG